MTDKTPIGIDFLDSRYGGAFRGRPLLVSGPAKSGKTAAAFHFLRRGLRLRERCLMLTAKPAADIVVQADAMGLDFTPAVESGDLILLEYADDVPGRYKESEITLPPNSFMQLAEIIAEQAVARLVLDSCLPWVAVKSVVRLEEHVFSFIRSLDRMGVTSLLTIPKAASLAASRLYKLIAAQVPISVVMDVDTKGGTRTLIVHKYLGMDDKVGLEIPFEILPGTGITELSNHPAPVATAKDTVTVPVLPPPVAVTVAPPTAAAAAPVVSTMDSGRDMPLPNAAAALPAATTPPAATTTPAPVPFATTTKPMLVPPAPSRNKPGKGGVRFSENVW